MHLMCESIANRTTCESTASARGPRTVGATRSASGLPLRWTTRLRGSRCLAGEQGGPSFEGVMQTRSALATPQVQRPEGQVGGHGIARYCAVKVSTENSAVHGV